MWASARKPTSDHGRRWRDASHALAITYPSQAVWVTPSTSPEHEPEHKPAHEPAHEPAREPGREPDRDHPHEPGPRARTRA